ncbi:helix-turn-helix domain-containing protein [Kitasatospora aureofaciens]|uniref:HTH cro/C1-type domain-containing protein n=1 Tax=Kitasatospora aureofaciens TaxID=1894 RepID=A0A1E7NEZ5_KITAU|nr:helix-turn-helix transcriptional regulator [Kitasatospora aureofaciens]ARF83296.1 transcriptional regulator [Kitasatospora aureofaciens]OEV39063.1 hypothetical protein HS99_0018370 [Kitasatospora aureofaciens]GGV03841.1 hypothetical protein GCM10010502_68240 [Kitasatospora aureofaciens]
MPEPEIIIQLCEYCEGEFTRTSAKGRPRRFCKAACRAKASRAAARRRAGSSPAGVVGEYDVTVSRLALQAMTLARRLQKLSESGDERPGPCAGLELVAQLRDEVDALTAAVVLQARERRVRWPMVAEILEVSADTARSRWSLERGGRLLQLHQQRRRAASQAAARRRADAERKRHGPGLHALPVGAPTDPEAQLTSALSHLQRASGKSIRRVAEETELSASFVSRLFSGERFPSWPTVEQVVSVLGGEPEQVRTLWQAARGEELPRPFLPGRPTARAEAAAGLQAAVQGLHLASARPSEREIASRAPRPVTTTQVASVLHGSLVDWPVVAAVVEALRGHPDQVRPWWECVQLSLNPYWTPQQGSFTAISAGAFG